MTIRSGFPRNDDKERLSPASRAAIVVGLTNFPVAPAKAGAQQIRERTATSEFRLSPE
jgi:hypothetical protein